MTLLRISHVIACICIFSNLSLYCQSTTFEKCISTKYDEMCWDAIHLNDTCYFLLTQKNNGLPLYLDCNIQIYQLSHQGILIDSLIITPPSDYQLKLTRHIFDIGQDEFLVVGRCSNRITEDNLLYLCWISSNLDFISDTIIGDTSLSVFYSGYTINENNNLIAVGSFQDTITHNVIMEFNLDNKTSRKTIFDRHGPANQIKEVPERNVYHVFPSLGGDSITEIGRDSLDVISRIYFGDPFFPVSAIDIPLSPNYIVAGRALDTLEFLFKSSYRLLDSAGTVIDQKLYGVADINYFYAINEVDCNSSSYFFLGGTHNFTEEPPFILYPEQRWIFINKLRMDGSIIWQHFYKGEVNYMPYKVLATSDGGALILSHRYDWNSPYPNQRDIHILKVDSNGYYSGMVNVDEITKKPLQILIYPNPASTTLNIATGHYSGLDFILFNLQGKEVLRQKLHGSMHTISVDHLPPAIYICRFYHDRQLLETSKIVIQ